MIKIDAATFLACCLSAEKHDELSRREYARFVLDSYLNYPAAQLTDAEKTERFERARRDGVEVVGRFGRKRWVTEGVE